LSDKNTQLGSRLGSTCKEYDTLKEDEVTNRSGMNERRKYDKYTSQTSSQKPTLNLKQAFLLQDQQEKAYLIIRGRRRVYNI
jgi:hypothetical protein